MNLSTAWSTKQILGQLGLHNQDPVSRKTKPSKQQQQKPFPPNQNSNKTAKWWLIPVILATLEADFRIGFEANSSQDPISGKKNPS
jgi:hypothetical protein